MPASKATDDSTKLDGMRLKTLQSKRTEVRRDQVFQLFFFISKRSYVHIYRETSQHYCGKVNLKNVIEPYALEPAAITR